MKNNVCLLGLCVAVAFALVGCKTARPVSQAAGKPRAWNISITKKTTASIEVDLIGVASPNEENFLKSVSRDAYWNNPQIRDDQRKLGNLLTKFPQQNQPWIVKEDNPQWKTWLNRGVYELFVIARLPEATGDWRVPVLIGKKAWRAKDRTIEIVVVDSGIQILTPSRN